MILQNALVYTPRHTFERGTIIIRDGRIVPFAAPEEGEEVLDAEGLYALPGLVDIHFHGAMARISATAPRRPSRRWRTLKPARVCWPSALPT